jgi:hypothetical protein
MRMDILSQAKPRVKARSMLAELKSDLKQLQEMLEKK